MNDIHEPSGGPDTNTEAPNDDSARKSNESFRTRIENLRRDTSREVVGGVAAGIGREFGIDPLLVRVAFVVLLVAGGGGLIFYLACWMFIPRDGSDVSGFGAEFKVSDDVQVRTVGLAVGFGLAVISMLSSTPWIFTGMPSVFPTPLVAFLVGVAVAGALLLSQKTKSNEKDAQTMHSGSTPVQPGEPVKQNSWLLFALTASVVVIAVGAISMYSQLYTPVSAIYYLATALGIIAVGTLIGTKWGQAGGLITAGIVVSVTLLIVQFAPDLSMGQVNALPRTEAAATQPIRLGMGQINVDLREVEDLDLRGRTLLIENGIGSIEVIVPKELDVDVWAQTRLGTVSVFEEKGTTLYRSGNNPDALRIEASLKIGEIKVIRR